MLPAVLIAKKCLISPRNVQAGKTHDSRSHKAARPHGVLPTLLTPEDWMCSVLLTSHRKLIFLLTNPTWSTICTKMVWGIGLVGPTGASCSPTAHPARACGWLVTQHGGAGPKCCQVPGRPMAMATSDGSLWASVHAPSGHPCKNMQIIAGRFCCYGKSYVSISKTNPYLEEFSNVTIKLCSEP